MMLYRFLPAVLIVLLHTLVGCQQRATEPKQVDRPAHPLSKTFAWKVGAPILETDAFREEEWIAIKDPSLVHYKDRWHLFCTLRGHERSHAMVYTSFEDFENMGQNKPVLLPNHTGYFCAPQVFYFTPQEKWYMICQAKDSTWDPIYQAAFATTDRIENPDSWSALKPMGVAKPLEEPYLDFWVICDEEKAHLFYTSDNGHRWRVEASIPDFPYGWSAPELAFDGDIFEGSHIYKLTDSDLYINLIEARLSEDRRYFKAYTATQLDGEWNPLAADSAQAFADMTNVQFEADTWTNSISHGELIRAGYNERMEAQLPADFIFQGVLHEDRKGKPYGEIPWDLGLLRPKVE
ncbi:MAG: non-reducing end alpha-L-arabinofuranosidase family hydrolase [Bacteroidota bacterium]